MTTDFSQAIVNGFGIAAKWREMNQQEQEMRLTEAFRRDAAAEQKRQFNLGLAETTAARNQQDARVGEKIGLQREDLAARKIYQEAAIRQGDARIGLAERAMNEEKDARDRAEENAYIGQLALMKFERERAGNPMSEQEQLQYFAGNPIGRRALGRIGLPTESVRDGTQFDTAVTGSDGSVTVAGKRKDGSLAVPDVGRTHDNRTPPYTMAPGNVTALVTGAIMSTPEGIAAARQHAALTSGRKQLEMTEAEIEQAIVAAEAASRAQFQAAKEAEAKAAPAGVPVTNEGIDLGGSRAQRAWRAVSGFPASLGNLPSRLVDSGWNPSSRENTAGETPSLAQSGQPPARPPLQEPAPITALPADHPLMQRRAALRQQQEEANRFSRGLAMGYTPEQAGIYSTTGTPSESVASAQIRELGDLARRADAAAAARDNDIEAGYKALASDIDAMTKGDEWLESQRGAMTSIMAMANVTTGGALGADEGMRTTFASNLVSLMRMGDQLKGVDPRYRNDIIGAMAMKSVNASSASTFDVKNPEQVAQVAENLNTLYRGVPEGISPKQQALLAELAASDYSMDQMAAARDEIIKGTPDKVDRMFQQTFRY